ncbi:zinc finger lsd1 subclass family protein (macronuclear) [Tetrahymena thermophila SB210]|uniref:Zinc finger lsd1 subclass family protein n=1 Tax=Tetrahymena thermophila (strain SB210) TaxID=312017 RepID=Q22M95_TETTS|nr:zinc finger lsd1 subclass family protein [Tetrahymena thermophila SB210]EAR86282.2 zinc finger lsd1 subclass family protein [Tetrahymena thermophila SB210]|eukprot:XP_977125.2 zinc finger lsd1 subclass family protein [Tetrahymena thermophila SB210]
MNFKKTFILLFTLYQLAKAQIDQNSNQIAQYPFQPLQNQSSASISYQINLLKTQSQNVPAINAYCISENDTFQINYNNTIRYLGLEFINIQIKFNETYDFLVVSLDFIKFGLWSAETSYLQILDTSLSLYDTSQIQNKQGNPDKYCTNPNINGNSTKYSFSTLVPQNNSNYNVSIGSNANLPENQWSISNLLFILYKCKQGFAFNKSTKQCDPCPQNCVVCSNSKQCSKCNDTFNLYNQAYCQKNCPDGYFASNGTCFKCLQICKSCESADKCLVCNNNPSKDICQDVNLTNCSCNNPTQYGICLKQNPSCKNYVGQNGQNCDKSCYCQDCNNNDFLQDNKCVSSCSKGYFQYNKTCVQQCLTNYIAINNVCQLCDKSCQNCKNKQYYCQKCVEQYFPVYFNDRNDFICVGNQSQDKDIFNQCKSLQYKYLFIDSQNKYFCYKNCPFFIDNSNPQISYCKSCQDPNCNNCSQDYKNCSQCKLNYTSVQNLCTQNCSDTIQKDCACLDGYYINDDKCLKCSNLDKNCSKCSKDGCNLCNSGFYLNDMKQCVTCSTNCKICTNSTDCQECQSQYFKNNQNQCITGDICNQQGYIQGNQCIQCKDYCQTCISDSNCTSCKEGFYLFKKDKDNQTCETCSQGYIDIDQKTCVQSCSQGYIDTNKCTKCSNQNCYSCSIVNNQQFCNKCTTGYYLIKQTGECVKSCPQKTFQNQADQTCSQCSTTCETCKDLTNCLTCPQNQFLINLNNVILCNTCEEGKYYYQVNQTCVDDCPIGIGGFNNQNQRQCVDCQDQNCLKCSTLSLNTQQANYSQQCLICRQGYLLNGTCVNNCPDSMYNDTQKNTCELCPKECKTCSSLSQCISCFDGQSLYNGTCVSSCPDSFYQDQNNCVACPQSNCLICDKQNCKKCKANNVYIQSENPPCVSCPSTKYVLDKNCNQCLQSLYLNYDKQECVSYDNCKDGYYIDGNLCSKCLYQQNCSQQTSLSQIQNCTNQKLCISCPDGYYLSIEGYCNRCPKGCKLCTAADQCSSCNDNYCPVNNQCYLISGSDGEHDITNCDNFNQFCVQQDPTKNGICLQCIKGKDKCSMCDSNSYLYNSQCLLNCPPDYIADKNIYLEKFIYSGICRTSCLSGYKQAINEKCFYCPDFCQNCTPLADSNLAKQLGQNYNCTQCNNDINNQPYYMLQLNQIQVYNCVQQCPTSYFVNSQSQCIKCGDFCQECKDEKTCNTCLIGYFLDIDNSCVQNCQKGYYQDFVQKKCIKCLDDDCAICSQNGYCQQCNKKYLLNGQCVENCGDYYFANIQDQTCQRCILNCQQCSDQKSCSKCQQGAYYQVIGENYSCQKNCLLGFYPQDSNQTCQKCDIINCSKCSQSNQCELCDDTYFLLIVSDQNKLNYSCVKSCGSSYYANAQTKMCTQCQSNCLECSIYGVCQKCNDKFYLTSDTQQCVDKCSQGYSQVDTQCIKCADNCQNCQQINQCTQCQLNFYLNGTTCLPCIPNCQECVNNTTCNQCINNYYYTQDTNICSLDCSDGYFKSINFQCIKCSNNCKVCKSENACQTCNDNYYLTSDTQQCVDKCSQGYSQVDTQCIKCADNCQNCQQINQCTQCQLNFYLNGTTCQPCIPNCQECVNNTTCNQCINNYYYTQDTNICSLDCSDGYFKSINFYCIKCSNNCKVCKSENTCQTCNDNNYLTSDTQQCVDKCSQGYSQVDTQCIKCADNCQNCQQINQCTQCQLNFYLNGTTCQPCIPNCQECVNNTTCNQCINNYYYTQDTNICSLDCSDGYFKSINFQCIKCSNNCKVCKSENTCQTCNDNNYLTSDTQQCVDKCSQGYSQVDTQCIKCADNCQNCQQINQCTQCQLNFYLNGTTCQPCIPNCQECVNNITCNQCINNYYYTQDTNICSLDCSDGYFKSINFQCIKCSNNCKVCKSENACQTCNDNYYLTPDTQQCVDKCSQGYSQVDTQCIKCADNCQNCQKINQCTQCQLNFYLNGTTCQPCIPNCQECVNNTTCNQCINNYYYTQDTNICSLDCSDGYFKSINFQCIKCSNNCKVCKSENTCQTCNDNYYLTSDSLICIDQCPQGYSQIGAQCIKCADNCLKCQIANECTQCLSSFYLDSQKCSPCISNCAECQDFNQCEKCKSDYLYTLDKNTCDQHCPLGYFNQFGTNECSKCINNCNICETQDKCQSCNDGFFLRSDYQDCVSNCQEGYSQKGTQCIKCLSYCIECDTTQDCKKCQQGFYLDVNKACQKCSVSNCISCQTNNQSCDICQQNYVFDSQTNQCLQKCPENNYVYQDSNQGYFCKQCISNCQQCSNSIECKQCKPSFYVDKQNNNTCSQCIENCINCNSNSNSCDECQQDYYFTPQLNKCTKQCLIGYFPTVDTGKRLVCQQCDNNCDSCKSSSQCEQCSQSFYLRSDTFQCVDKCPNGYSLIDTSCIKCVRNCQNCSDMNTCLQCRLGFYLNNDQQCVACQVKNCDVCQNTSNQCQVCALGFILSLDQSSCIEKCPEGQFSELINKNQICSQCSQNCSLCQDKVQCNQCIQGFTLINKQCVQCNVSQCNSCDTSVQICDQCNSSLYVSSNQLKCVSQCQPDEYLDSTQKMCKKCPQNCKKCSPDQICQECQSPYLLNHKNKCIQCDPNYYFDFQSKTCAFCDESNGNFIQNNVCKKCNYTCQTCSGISINECLTCPKNRILYLNRCICQEGYIENSSQDCQKQQIDSNGLQGMQSGMTSLSAVSMIGGAGTASSLRGMEVSQMVSFLTYVNVNYQGNSNQYLKILYSDNLSPIFPNVLQGIFEHSSNKSSTNQPQNQTSIRILSQEVYVDSYQQTDFKFMVNQKTNNFLFNVSPLIILHLSVALLLLVKFLVYRYTKLQYSKKKAVVWIKNNFRQTVYLLIFYLTYQELLLIVLLQLTKPFSEQAVSIVGSILTLLVSFYMIYLLYFIFKVVLFMPYLTVKEKNQKFGCIFYGLKENRTAQIFILIKFIQKTAICMCTIYAYHSDQVLPQIVISGIVFLYELMIRPFYYKLAAFASFLLNALYLALLFLSYLIKSEQQNNSSTPSLNYSDSFEKILLAFIIVKNVIVLVDIIILVYGFFKIIRGKRSISTSTEDVLSNRTSADLESSLSKSITWRNNPLMMNNFNSVKAGKQNMSEIQNEFRRTDSTYFSDSPPTRKDSSSPILKKTQNNIQRSSPPGQLDSTQILQNQILGKEILVVKWKQNKLFKNDMNDAL